MNDNNTGVMRWIVGRLFVFVVAVALTLGTFLVLPVLQTIASGMRPTLTVRDVNTGWEPPPPPPPPEEVEEEEEEPPEPPKLMEDTAPLDLSQLELALNPGFGEGLFGDFAVNLGDQLASGDGDDENRVFSLDELDKRPRAVFQRQPTYPRELTRSKRKGTVYVVFLVDTQGRVVNPRVQKSTDPAFETAALEAVRQWKFEPGTRNGKKVQSKVRVPITFNPS